MAHHLSHDRFMNVCRGEGFGETREHWAECDSCRTEQEKLQRAIAGLRAWALAEAERPETFWTRQRSAIRRALEQASPARARRLPWALATAAAFLVLALALLTERAPQKGSIVADDPEHELLIEVQRSVRREIPTALEPASLLVHELGKAATPTSLKTQGEKQ